MLGKILFLQSFSLLLKIKYAKEVWQKMYNTNNFLKYYYNKIQPKKDLLSYNTEEFESVKLKRIELLKQILKLDELKECFDKNKLTFEIENNFESMGIQVDKYNIDGIEQLPFPVYHVKPSNPKGKTILYLHGHDDIGIMGALLERYDKVRYHKMIPLKLAKEGYDVYAPELLGLGEARFEGFPKGTANVAGCLPNSNYLTLMGFSLGGFRVYQIIKTLDFMEEIGQEDKCCVFGVSGGGMSAQQILAIDNRIDSGIVACYSNTYDNSILAKEHCVCNYVPGLLRLGDSAQLLALAAPKKLFTVNGEFDRGFPKEGSETAFNYLQKIYEKIGQASNYSSELIMGKHEIDEDVIINWLNNNI